ncbi:46 kDa FK506-binding nuclear protein-like isoform X2 [Cydia pomonella]|uniref:46 kDa FK506-binding nuclear protein-like isoform X2 n=1 Tax=Cydia pomonella TaxID=82600 RepID=UPI002ADE095D|nr:46 kDa FK506-binding nuclear protein-like isoform X2 [Cydia pomonella]
MKCVIFSMLLAVALALPAPKPDDDDNNPQNQNHPDSRRSLVPLFNSRSLSKASSDREDDDDDNSTYEKYARSNSDREDDDDDNNDESYSRSSSSKRSDSDREDDENSTYESRSDSSNSNAEVNISKKNLSFQRSYKSSQRVAELSSYLDYLNDKYEGQGVLKVEYTPSSKKFNKYTRTHNLGSLHFSYHPPDKSYRAKNYKNYFVYSPSGKVQGSYGSSSYKSKFQPFESYKSDESSSSEYEPYFSSDFSPYKSRSFKKSLFSKSNSQDNFDDDSN